MGQPTAHPPALLLLAAFSRHGDALDWAKRRAEEAWGRVAMESSRFLFDDTDYYTRSMGPELKKVFWIFAPDVKNKGVGSLCSPKDACFTRVVPEQRLPTPLFPPALVDVKLATNAWEDEYAAAAGHNEARPLNLDPGYLTLGKLVLASTKDFAHRIYLDRGIYAETTLYYRHGSWEHHRFTFADYQRADYQDFFSKCREYLKKYGTTDGHR